MTVRIRGKGWAQACVASVLAGMIVVSAGATALAQTPPARLPSTAEPRPLEDRVAPPSALESRPPPAVTPEEPPDSPLPPGAVNVSFEVTDIVIEGATVYDPERFAPFYEDLIGRTITLAELYGVARDIENLYREDGYVLSRAIVPAQTVDDGIFRIAVVEGFINEVIIQGEIGPARTLVERYLNQITDFRPIRLQDMERYLLLANDVPGVTALGVLQPAEGDPGAARLIVSLERQVVDGLARIDNRGSHFAGPVQTIGRVGLNSFTEYGDRTQVTVFSTGISDESLFGEALVSGRFGDEGLTVTAFANVAPAEPGASLEPLEVESRAARVGFSGEYPLIRTRRTNLNIATGFDAANVDVDVFDLPFSEDRLRVLWGAVSATHQDTLGGFSTIDLELRRGLSFFGASEDGDDLLSRADGDPTFTTVQLDVSRLQSLTDNFSLFGAVSAQYALDPLLADEEFTLGGVQFGRGYDPSELTGDHGVGATVELQYTPSGWRPPFIEAYQLYAFYDVGAVWDESEDGQDRQSLASAGFGVRTQINDYFYLDLEAARPLTRAPANQDDEMRYFFTLTGTF